MASVIERPDQLPGETVRDVEGRKLGKVEQLYGVGDQGEPMWVTVELSTGIAQSRVVFVPLARLKQEHDQLRVPYTAPHLLRSPEVEAKEELSKRDDIALRNFYAIDLADQEIRSDNETYANQVADGEQPPRQVAGAD